MMTGGSVPASSPTSPVASDGGASPRNADQAPEPVPVVGFAAATLGRLGEGVKIGGRRGGCENPGGHDGFAEDVAGAAETAPFAAGCAFGVGRSGAFG